MKRNSYYPGVVGAQIGWLQNFCNKFGGYATPLGLTTAQVDAIQADCGWLIYVLQSWLISVRTWSQACSAASKMAQTGDGAALMVLPVFTAPALPTGVAAVNTGALNRIFREVQLMKEGGKLTAEIAEDLGVVGAEMTPPDFATLQPDFKARALTGLVSIDWNWGGNAAFLDQIEIHVDRNDTQGFRFLTQDTTPGYNDTAPQPTTPTKWTYKAIFRVDDAPLGLWSNPVSVIVGG